MPWAPKAIGPYSRGSEEAYDNALMVYACLYYFGWTLEATCGVLGNIEAESGYNPWRWQSDIVLPYQDPRIEYQNAHAYGLCQWDPAGKYINAGGSYPGYGPNYSDRTGSKNDGTAQMWFLDQNADYYPTETYPLTYAQYKAATIDQYTISYLAHAWFANFERGTWSDNRVTAAEFWYQEFGGVIPPEPPGRQGIPIWLLFKLKEVNKL